MLSIRKGHGLLQYRKMMSLHQLVLLRIRLVFSKELNTSGDPVVNVCLDKT